MQREGEAVERAAEEASVDKDAAVARAVEEALGKLQAEELEDVVASTTTGDPSEIPDQLLRLLLRGPVRQVLRVRT